MYNGQCRLTFTLDTSLGQPNKSYPCQVAINSKNEYMVTDMTDHVKIYDQKGQFKCQWVSSCPDAPTSPSSLHGLAMDSNLNVLVGDNKGYRIHKHGHDGTYLSSIEVGIQPRYIAVTSQDTIVVADWLQPPKIVNPTGHVLYTLRHPDTQDKWSPAGVCCFKDTIMIANLRTYSILSYSESGKYRGRIPIPDVWPHAMALSHNGLKLVVCEPDLVKVFCLRDAKEEAGEEVFE